MTNKNEADACRICGSRSLTTLLSDLKTRLGESYSLKRCNACSFVSVEPLPAPEKLEAYYAQEYWQRYDGAMGALLTHFYRLRVSGIIKDIKGLVPPKGRILDWGAGDGALVKLLEEEGYKSYGIDTHRSGSSQKNVITATIEQAPFREEAFDAITCFHVLEHLYEPVSSLKKALRLLKPGGVLIVETPNHGSIGFSVFKERWYPLDVPVHLNHFNPKALRGVFAAIGGAQVIKTAHFSHRHAPSSLVLSLLPAISPPRVRAKYSGRFPLPLMMVYLLLQVVSYPFAILEAFLRRGEVLRMCVQKESERT